MYMYIFSEVKLLAQQLVDKWLKVVKTEQWHSMMSDKEGLTKQETLDNVKSDSVGPLIYNTHKIDSGASSESVNDSTLESKPKNEKMKVINENEKVTKRALDRTKKDKNSTSIKVKEEHDKSKETPKLEKEKLKDQVNNESDDLIKDKKRRLKDKNGNPFLRIIGEMTDEKSDENKQVENDNLNISKQSSRRKQNLKNLSSGEKMIKSKLLNESKKSGHTLNSTTDTKKEPRPLPPLAPKPKLPESKTILEKKNYSINIEKKEFVGEKKPTIKTFNTKFRSTGLEEQPPPPPSKSKVQSKKSTKNLAPLSLKLISKAEKRSLSPPSDSPNEKKPKHSPTEVKKPPRKISHLYLIIYFLWSQKHCYSVSANFVLLIPYIYQKIT